MTDKIDEFESLFRSADKPTMIHDDIEIRRVLIVTDDRAGDTAAQRDAVISFLPTLSQNEPDWQMLEVGVETVVPSLLSIIQELGPDLIVARRNLSDAKGGAERSLGVLLDEMLWVLSVPVIILPDGFGASERVSSPPRTVMVATDHLTGDNRLVDYGARITPADGLLVLAHIEDDASFERYMSVIGKTPEIDTETARTRLREQLMQTPRDYVDACIRVLRDAGVETRIESVVRFGHQANDYRELVQKHGVELLCLHAERDDAPAMLGMAMMIATRFRELPLLLI
jgi:hypothetical protein